MSKNSQQVAHSRPRFGKIPQAQAYSGRGRSTLYGWASRHPGLFRKDGVSTIVDFDLLDRILDALPVAEIKAPAPRRARACADANKQLDV